MSQQAIRLELVRLGLSPATAATANLTDAQLQVFRNQRALGICAASAFDAARESPAVAAQPTKSELERALSFCYALLGADTVEEAAAIWRSNPERRMEAHRAIYARKPQPEPYDEMMARCLALRGRVYEPAA